MNDEVWAAGKRWGTGQVQDGDYTEIEIEYDDVAWFVANQVRNAKIAALEQANTATILGYHK